MRKMARPIAMIAALALVLAACGGEEGGSPVATTPARDEGGGEAIACDVDQIDGDLHLYNWTGYIDPQLITAFEEEYGVDVVEDFYDSNETMLAKLQSGAVYDLIVPSDYMVGIMIEDGLLAEIQRDALSNISNLGAAFVDPAYDPGGVFSVAYQWGTTGLGVNTEVVGKDYQATWGLVFDPELIAHYPGGVSLLDDPRETMGAALKYLGYSLNSTSEEELQEAADVIAAAKEFIAAFDSDQYDEILVTGRLAVAHGSSRKFSASFDDVDGSDTYSYVIPDEGASVWIDTMALPANAEHPCTAHTFINYLLDAENGAVLTNWNLFASPNAASEKFVEAEILEDEAIYPSDDIEDLLEIIEDTGVFEIQFTNYFAIARS
ncbi:MAG: spermidine/putrescine ABC transporter substrate-binding protein [Actinomycetota bacterium]|nr:spermidine/putrescine ABC transporter substrate-binding protein [Actinomycetota bacterium]